MRCRLCGRSFRPRANGRPRKFCSDACRQKAWRARSVTKPSDSAAEIGMLQVSEADRPHGAIAPRSTSCGETTSTRAL